MRKCLSLIAVFVVLACPGQAVEAPAGPQSDRAAAAEAQAKADQELAATVLFCEIRNFTALAERLDSGEVAELLTEFFERGCAPLLRGGGRHLKFVGDGLVEWFMWMCPVELAGGTRLEAYKHRITRRYLYLDAAGGAWGYVETRRGGGRYRRMASVATALELVLSPWWETDLVEPEEIVLCWQAIERARLRDAA